MDFIDQFTAEIAQHQMQVIRDDGVNRHLRFKRPGTMTMHFDLVTWPGYLCYTGDMGTYVFRRLHDMFEFFRRDNDRAPYRIDLRYWAEKLQADDHGDGVRKWDQQQFEAEVRDYFEQYTSDEDEWPDDRKAALWQAIDEQVCRASIESEHHAWTALLDFEHDGLFFRDWESDCKVWTHYFLWCCHALEWAIGIYDAQKAGACDTTAD